jgi:hypothetical protein
MGGGVGGEGLERGRSTQSRQNAKLFLGPRNWDSPNPSPAGECAPPRFWGKGHTRWRQRGWNLGLGESQFRLRYIHCGTLFFIYTYYVEEYFKRSDVISILIT